MSGALTHRGALTRGAHFGFVFCLLAASRPVSAQAIADRLGCTHVAGRYAFTTHNYLEEGATQILRTGMRVIKVYLSPGGYPFNSDWPPFLSNQVQVAQHPYYQALFSRPFTTFVLTTYSSVSPDGNYWRTGITDQQAIVERQEFYALARYLLTTYRGTGKTFILQHWEGDWSLRGTTDLNPAFDPQPVMCENMVTWLNARQDGVDLARAEVTDTDVKVYHAPELNLGDLALQGRPTVTNSVLPGTHCDLYSYSAWDGVSGANGPHFRDLLDYIASKAPDKAPFGNKNVYIGEYGWPELAAGTAYSTNVIKTATATALNWGCPYVIFWQVYDNECTANPTSNSNCPGYWMFRVDGSLAPSHDYFVSLLNSVPPGINLARWGASASADSVNSGSETASRAIDGVIASNSKWTSAGTPAPHWLALDLGKTREIHTLVVRHAGTGGETNNYNTRQFRIQSSPSLSGPWTDEFVVDNASDKYNLTLRNYFDRKSLRYVRLYITSAGIDNYARIPEFEVWGDPGVAAFSAAPLVGDAPLNVQFTGASTGNIDVWSWDFGDGTASSLPNPLKTYTRPGLHQVVLTVTSPSGIQSQATESIRVRGADFDGDGDVDQQDFSLLQRCFSGDAVPQNAPACAAARIDGDNDVDSVDLGMFLACMNGSDQPPGVACAFAP